MLLSDLIGVLQEVEREVGDKPIWDIECFSWNRPSKFTIELANGYEEANYGYQCDSTDKIEVDCSYDDLSFYRSIEIEKGQ